MKTRTNKRSIKNRRNTKKFRGGMDSTNPAPGLAQRRDALFNPDKMDFSEIGLDEPAGDDKQHTTPGVGCTQENADIMKQAQAERKKGSTTRSSTVQDGMKLIENEKGRLKASEFNCEFHPNNGWKMTNGRRFGFKSSSCPDCEKCITEDPPVDDQGNTPLSNAENNCGESAKKALKLFNSLQNEEIDANTVEACIKSRYAQAVPVVEDSVSGNIALDGNRNPISTTASEVGNPIESPAAAAAQEAAASVAVGEDDTPPQDATGDPSVNPAPTREYSPKNPFNPVGGKRKKSKSKRTRRRGRKTKRTRRRSRKTKRNKRKLKKRNSRKQ